MANIDVLDGLRSIPLRVMSFRDSHVHGRTEDFLNPTPDELQAWLDNTLNTVSDSRPRGDDCGTLHIIYGNGRQQQQQQGGGTGGETGVERGGGADPTKMLFHQLQKRLGIFYVDMFEHGALSGNVDFAHHPEFRRRKPDSRAVAPAEGQWTWRYSIFAQPAASTCWLSIPSKRTTFVLLFAESAHRHFYDSLTTTVYYIRNLPDYSLGCPLTWGIVILDLVAREIRSHLAAATNTILQAEFEAGLSKISNTEELVDPVLPEDLTAMTRSLVHACSQLVMWGNMASGCARLARFIQEENGRYLQNTDDRDPSTGACIFVENESQKLLDRCTSDEGYTERKVLYCQFVLQGLHAFIAQRDQNATLQLARESKTIAEESRHVADANWKNTTSVTAIAVIVMLFFPGTFMSSLFSAPFLGEMIPIEDSHKQLVTYWAVTASLTAAALATWYIWSQYSQHRQRTMRASSDPSAATKLSATAAYHPWYRRLGQHIPRPRRGYQSPGLPHSEPDNRSSHQPLRNHNTTAHPFASASASAADMPSRVLTHPVPSPQAHSLNAPSMSINPPSSSPKSMFSGAPPHMPPYPAVSSPLPPPEQNQTYLVPSPPSRGPRSSHEHQHAGGGGSVRFSNEHDRDGRSSLAASPSSNQSPYGAPSPPNAGPYPPPPAAAHHAHLPPGTPSSQSRPQTRSSRGDRVLPSLSGASGSYAPSSPLDRLRAPRSAAERPLSYPGPFRLQHYNISASYPYSYEPTESGVLYSSDDEGTDDLGDEPYVLRAQSDWSIHTVVTEGNAGAPGEDGGRSGTGTTAVGTETQQSVWRFEDVEEGPDGGPSALPGDRRAGSI